MTETFWAPEKYCYKQVEFTYYLEIFVSILLETWMWEWSFLFPFIHPRRRMYNQHWKPSCNSFSIQQPEGSFETRSGSMSFLCGLHLTQKKKIGALVDSLQVLYDLASRYLSYIISYSCSVYSGKQTSLLFLGHVRDALASGPLHLLVSPMGYHSPSYLHGSLSLTFFKSLLECFLLNPA